MDFNRRRFLQSAATAAAAVPALGGVSAGRSAADEPEHPVRARPAPTAAQRKWMDLKFGLFVHFGINTYYDVEWSDGTLDPARYNPTELDTEQWVRAAKDAGMNYVVLVTKHHDGFCNWPTRQTDYSVRATPWKKDLVAALVEAARKHAMEVGFYYSLWDCREKSHDEDEWAYVEFIKEQLAELLTGYGPVVELWFDGFWKKQQSGWTKKPPAGEASAEALRRRDARFVAAWRSEGAFRWQMDHLYQFVKQLQSDCLVMNNSTTAYPGVPLHPVDIRSGEKATKVVDDEPVWQFLGREVYLPLQIETTLSQQGKRRFKSGSWFWHEWDHSVATKAQILGYLDVARRMDANLLLNAGPMANGRLRPEDLRALRSLRAG